MRRAYAVVCAWLGLVLVLSAPAEAGPLERIYQRALEQDAEFAAAKASLDAGKEAWPQARAAALPQINATGSYLDVERDSIASPFSSPGGGSGDICRQDVNPTNVVTPFEDCFSQLDYEIELRQPLFDWGIPAQLRKGRKRVTVAKLDFASAETQLRARVMRAYIGFLDAESQLRFARAERKAIASDLERTRARHEVGEVSITALREARAAFDLAKSRIIEARTAMDEARENLREITGAWFDELPGIVGEIPLQPPDPHSADAWVDIAMEYNAAYLAALQEADIAEDEITERESDLLPRVDAVLSLSATDNTGFVFGGESEDRAIGVEATWNLFSGGRDIAEVREARALYDQSHAELEQTRRRVATAVRNAYRRTQSNVARVQALEQAVESARTALESVRGEFDVGERTQTDVLDARRDLFSALTDAASARYSFLSSMVDLKLNAGVLSREDLMRLDGRLGKGERATEPESE